MYENLKLFPFILAGEFLEKVLRHLGLVRLDNASVFEIFFWLAPEIIVLPTTLLIYYFCRQLTHIPTIEENVQRSTKKTEDRSAKVSKNLRNIIIQNISKSFFNVIKFLGYKFSG